ncbi:MAG: TrkH family potassium uptake protein [Nitrospira sp.]|nr:Trk family potassium uptake protein [Candidatus Manganitrophaceae bacterium]
MKTPLPPYKPDFFEKTFAPLLSFMRRVRIFSLSGILVFSFLLDFSQWLPLPCKLIALLLQGGVVFKLIFEERYLFFRFRRLTWQKRLLPIALFGISLLFYAEKGLLFIEMFSQPAGSLTQTYRLYSIIFLSSAFAIYTLRINVIVRFLSHLRLRPAQTLALGFIVIILLGTLLLSLPQMVTDPSKISLIDALFTSTSATTVTGLVLFPISEYYQPTGLWVILALIQLGGLGIMTFGVVFSLMSHKRMGLNAEIALQGALDTESVGNVQKEILQIFLITLLIESFGALLLWVFFTRDGNNPFFTAIFHAISAFCNAGFSLFPRNLEGQMTHLPVNLIIAFLIILGGFGFPVLNNLLRYPFFSRTRTNWRLSFHSKMVLSISAGLLLVGTLGIYILEYSGTLSSLSWYEKWVAAAFQSVTARTAGFNALDPSHFRDATLLLLIILMWIGGSPASTAGGIKTTTFGVMLATLRAMLRNREEVSLFKRSVSPLAVQKSLSIAFVSSGLVALLLLLLLSTEQESFKSLLFETVSAYNTVGLSIGTTSRLSQVGKLIIILTMFLGRIGPLTLAFILAERASKGKYNFPRERVIVG